MNTEEKLEHQYAASGLRERLDSALASAGLATGPIDWRVLSPLDQFHTRGLQAVEEVAQLLNPGKGDHVIDLGSGFGGPARYLAATYGCKVTGIELTPLYVEIANELTSRTGLSDRAEFIQGDATKLPFGDDSFDRALTVHVSMNIENKSGFYESAFRVLKPGGTFAIYDVVEGNRQPVIYPAPWAPTPEYSFLSSLTEVEQQLGEAGFTTLVLEDATEGTLEWLERFRLAPTPDSASSKPLSLPEVVGPQMGPMLKNLAQNFLEGRTRVLRALVQKN